MDISQYVLLGAVIAGATELVTQLRARDYWKAVTIMVAAVIGGVFGFFHVEGLPTTAHGIAAGLAASGFITTLSHFGSRR